MKTRTKITVTLAVGIGLLVGSMGVASASPHYSDWNGKTGFTAPVSSYIKLGDIKGAVEAPVSSYREDGAGRLSGFTHHANIDRLHQEVVSFESGPVRPLA